MKWLLAFILLAALPAHAQKTEKAIFAAGCFWCTEQVFQDVPGVISAVSGYTGGRLKNPSYEQVSSGLTGHTEAVEVTFDPSKVTYEQLLDIFWVNHDPTVTNRQFCDSGEQYRPSIFYFSDQHKQAAEASKVKFDKLKTFRGPLLTPIVAAGPFYAAEDYHQDFYKKNPVRYRIYRFNCGRDARLEQVWGLAKP